MTTLKLIELFSNNQQKMESFSNTTIDEEISIINPGAVADVKLSTFKDNLLKYEENYPYVNSTTILGVIQSNISTTNEKLG